MLFSILLLTGAIANPNRNFQYSLFPIGIDNITCNGQETSLLDCTHSRGRELCRTQTTALVICRGKKYVVIKLLIVIIVVLQRAYAYQYYSGD